MPRFVFTDGFLPILWNHKTIFDEILSLRLDQIGSVQAMAMKMYIFNWSNHVKNGNLKLTAFIVSISSIALAILACVILPLCQCGPNLIITMGQRAPFLHQRTLSKTQPQEYFLALTAINRTAQGTKYFWQ